MQGAFSGPPEKLPLPSPFVILNAMKNLYALSECIQILRFALTERKRQTENNRAKRSLKNTFC